MKKTLWLIGLFMMAACFLASSAAFAKSQIDIVFIIDRSGSMGDDINDVRINIEQFVDELSRQGFDYQLGLLTYESGVTRYELTSDVQQFKRYLSGIRDSGSIENGLDAIMDAIDGYTYELNSFKYFVLIGDEKIYSRKGYSDAGVQQQLVQQNITLTAVGVDGAVKDQFKKFSDATGGLYLDIRSGFATNLAEIFEQIQQIPIVEALAPSEHAIYSEFDHAFIPRIQVLDPDSDTLKVQFFVDGSNTPEQSRTITNTKSEQIVSFNAFDMGTLSEGRHEFLFRVDDGSDTVQDVVSFLVDKTAPVLSGVHFSVTEDTVSISGNASDATAGLHNNPYSFSVGNANSGWKASSSHVQHNLQPNRTYAASFRARDRVGHIAEKTATLQTLADVPRLEVTEAREQAITLSFTDRNPLYTRLQIRAGSQYVNEDGALTASPSWITLQEKTLTVTGLMPNESYTFQARAMNEADKLTAYSAMKQATTLARPPDIPNANIGQRSIRIEWDPVANIHYYELEVDGQTFTNGTEHVYVHAGLSPNTRHTYRVRIRNAGGWSDWSPLLTVYTLPDPPPVPTGLTAEPSQTTMTVTWNGVARAEHYDLEADGRIVELGITTTYIDRGLMPETEHTYRIRARNPGGTSEWSPPITLTTLPYPPPAPDNLQAVLTWHSVEVSWDQAERAVNYEIEVDGLIVDNGDQNIYLHEHLQPLSGHTYRVRGVNAGGKGPWSEPLDVTTHPERPTQPDNIFTTSDDASISLTWYEVPHTDLYEVEMDGTRIETVKDPRFVHTGLKAESMHTYRIRAKNISGYSEWSREVHMITLPSMEGGGSEPMSLTNMAAVVTNQAITLTWDTVAPNAEYEIEVDGELQDIETDTVYHHGGLNANEYHMYRIRLKEETGPGYWVAILALSTLPDPPDAPARIDGFPSDVSITLTWERVEGATGYDIELDGETTTVGNIDSFDHEGLEPGTEHTYRIRARNVTGVTAWSPSLSLSTTSPTYWVEMEKDVPFELTLLANNVQDFSEQSFVVTYDPDELAIGDLYAFTPAPDTNSGAIDDSPLTVEATPGRLVFTVKRNIVPGTSWSGELTTIQFIPLATGQTAIDVTVE